MFSILLQPEALSLLNLSFSSAARWWGTALSHDTFPCPNSQPRRKFPLLSRELGLSLHQWLPSNQVVIIPNAQSPVPQCHVPSLYSSKIFLNPDAHLTLVSCSFQIVIIQDSNLCQVRRLNSLVSSDYCTPSTISVFGHRQIPEPYLIRVSRRKSWNQK